ncbi:helix-turn-helix domain-containing protein [Pedobacter heparinus]|uniref:Helix-turn-helix type 11 domain-containing protein n=1 Tax=Pedobacter heparinus (strain ATCC 13125 / DSM 2366 / CIP 104194 / JCM 7457 / NBRC 12017 / NCIMB 9290 / NRRL B-14731 / HIM 762-3) TaxID=485917 RepID=C6Y3I9_PEDHD|nr:helix-turn-helix domain-containing protein [Pedobacter heparinus]ACU03268.1 hypothetical protein Phep_1048 [Pedobacter heparinus DSM 2366]
MNLPLYQRLNELICIRNTGPVEVLAEKLNISPRQVKYIIKKMRQDCEAPICFDNVRQSYVYTEKGRCDFKFRANNKEIVTEAIDEALKKYFSPLILAWCLLPDLIKEIAILTLAV